MHETGRISFPSFSNISPAGTQLEIYQFRNQTKISTGQICQDSCRPDQNTAVTTTKIHLILPHHARNKKITM